MILINKKTGLELGFASEDAIKLKDLYPDDFDLTAETDEEKELLKVKEIKNVPLKDKLLGTTPETSTEPEVPEVPETPQTPIETPVVPVVQVAESVNTNVDSNNADGSEQTNTENSGNATTEGGTPDVGTGENQNSEAGTDNSGNDGNDGNKSFIDKMLGKL